jgi:hypothetical protein
MKRLEQQDLLMVKLEVISWNACHLQFDHQ